MKCYLLPIFLVTIDLQNLLQDTKKNDEFNCTYPRLYLISRQKAFWDVRKWYSAQSFSDSGMPKGMCVNCRESCMGIKATLGVIVNLTISCH